MGLIIKDKVQYGNKRALGETSSTAYRGDRGKAAYDHATAKGSAFASGLYKITTNAEGHVTAAATATIADILELSLPGINNAGFRNSIYRGANLGASVTPEQYDAINGGTFQNLYIGDYWEIGGVKWRIAAFDYWYGTGDRTCTTHHVLIVPDQNLNASDGATTHWMNGSNSTDGAYANCSWRDTNDSESGKSVCIATINTAFDPGHILSYRGYLSNLTAANGTTVPYETGGAWTDCSVEIMNERMVFGCEIYHNIMASGVIPSYTTIENTQLPLFRLDRHSISNRSNWWLRDVVSTTDYAFISGGGEEGHQLASHDYIGVRPAFGLKKA